MNIGDGLFFFDETSVDYPYSDDGARYWSGDTPFPDPFAINPVPRTHLPIFVGGTATPVLERAAKLADGFVSPNTTAAEIGRFAREIHDYRKVKSMDLTTGDIQRLAEHDKRAAMINPHIVVAVVHSGDLGFGMSRMWQAYTTEFPFVSRIFRSMDEARTWVVEQLKKTP